MSYKPNLEKGDFIAVAIAGAYIDLGWFIGFGKNSMLYYSMWSPYSHKGFCEARKIPINIKNIRKSYVISMYPGRVIKVTDPQSAFFRDEQIEYYKTGIEVLTELNFLNK